MNIPHELRYTADHEWLRVEKGEGIVGITDYAQGELGDIVFVDLPELGAELMQGKPFGSIEAVKAAADLYAPISGEVVAVNGLLDQQPELINKSPYGDGWIVRIKIADEQEIDTLLPPEEYKRMVAQVKGE
ncbi:MAG: glycine cleavage system protein GcvH [Calditrichaeota bacterium]|nr:glycine cleavage system protein GcvH [Calditrichota bacterium]